MTGPLAFDRALPLLSLIDDAEYVGRLLAAGPSVAVRRQDTKYQPGVRCLAGYELRPSSPGEAPALGAVAVTPRGIEGYRAERDPALPGLAEALDPTAMAPRFAGLLPRAGQAPPRCLAAAVRYKPGVRCVVRYDVGSAEDGAVFYGKLLPGASSGQVALVNALSRAVADQPDAPRVAPVLADWPDLGLLLQPAVVPADEVHRLATDASVPSGQRLDALRGAGRALAGLHACGLPEAPARSFADDLRELQELEPMVTIADPALGQRFAAVLATLHRRDDGRPDPPVTSHGAFRTDQLLLSQGRFVLIDLDTLCRSEPSRDLGNLLAYLDWRAVRHPAEAGFLASARIAVLDGYEQQRPAPARQRMDLHRAASLLKVAGRRYRSLATSEWPLVPQLLSAAAGLVAEKGGPQ